MELPKHMHLQRHCMKSYLDKFLVGDAWVANCVFRNKHWVYKELRSAGWMDV